MQPIQPFDTCGPPPSNKRIASPPRYNRSLTGSDFVGGVLVVQIVPASPAERGGLKAGDIITVFDGKPVSNTRHILERIGSKIGRAIALSIVRDGEAVELTIRTSESTAF